MSSFGRDSNGDFLYGDMLLEEVLLEDMLLVVFFCDIECCSGNWEVDVCCESNVVWKEFELTNVMPDVLLIY